MVLNSEEIKNLQKIQKILNKNNPDSSNLSDHGKRIRPRSFPSSPNYKTFSDLQSIFDPPGFEFKEKRRKVEVLKKRSSSSSPGA